MHESAAVDPPTQTRARGTAAARAVGQAEAEAVRRQNEGFAAATEATDAAGVICAARVAADDRVRAGAVLLGSRRQVIRTPEPELLTVVDLRNVLQEHTIA